MSPLVWDLGHIAAYEDLWLVHRHGGEPLLRPDLAGVYDAFETPRAVRGDIPLLDRAEALDYLADGARAHARGPRPRAAPSDGSHEMVLRHELQHTETMRQTMCLARPRTAPGRAARAPRAAPPAPASSASTIPGRRVRAWARRTSGFAYDNERPRHAVDAAGLPHRAAPPVTNATWLHFVEGGGYERREWWSDEGWAWKEEYDITAPAGLGRRPTVAAWRIDDAPCTRAVPRLLVRGRRLRPQRTGPASRPRRSGRRRRPGPRTPLQDVGHVWEWTVDRVRRLPRLRRPPVPRVLRGLLRRRLPRPARRLVGDRAARRDADLPQLGPPAAPADLRRRATREGRERDGADLDGTVEVRSYLGPATSARSPTTCSTA